MALPSSFISPVHLPFNAACLQGRFHPAPPDADPGGEGCWLLLRGAELLISAGEPLQLPVGTGDRLAGAPLYLGSWEGRPCRTVAVSADAPLPAELVAESLLAPEPRLSIEQLTLGGLASQALHWELNSQHCVRCGGVMERLPAERGKRCRQCRAEQFPPVHPCVIVLVRRPGEVLLTRKAAWPAGRYSLVAGFLDLGECLEEAVVREVREETGVEIGRLRYRGSQSWPFPSQLMAGFTAEYVAGEVRVEEKELEDARWFAVDALPLLPPRRSIARWLLDCCLQEER
ncbi:MAG: NAD(+) diphosphatase [Desulfuromonadales bacterium]|nr:NAD(+) diphosphatase [Desulfuromonadales bacterium]